MIDRFYPFPPFLFPGNGGSGRLRAIESTLERSEFDVKSRQRPPVVSKLALKEFQRDQRRCRGVRSYNTGGTFSIPVPTPSPVTPNPKP